MKIRIGLRRAAGKTVKILHRNGALTFRTSDVNGGVKSHKSNAYVARVGGDAMLARSQYGVHSVVPLNSRAAAARNTLIAFAEARVVEVVTASALKQVATH